MTIAATDYVPVNSGAAGAAKFAGSDSRKYNYFTPKGRKATHYEDMTLDVQPDPKRYLLQDWIISFADGTPTYFEGWTQAKSSDWHAYRAVDEEWERTHYQRQSTIEGMIAQAVENGRRSGAPTRFDKAWVKVLEKHVGAYKHAEFGLATALMQAQRYGYTQMVNSTILTNSSYKMRFAQDLTLYLGDIGQDIPGFDAETGKTPLAIYRRSDWKIILRVIGCRRGQGDLAIAVWVADREGHLTQYEIAVVSRTWTGFWQRWIGQRF